MKKFFQRSLIAFVLAVCLAVCISGVIDMFGDDEPRPPLAPTTKATISIDSVEIVSVEPMDSGLPGFRKVEFSAFNSNDIRLAFVSDSIPASDLVQGRWLKIALYDFHPNYPGMSPARLYFGMPVGK